MGDKRPSKASIPIRTGPPESASTMTSTVSHHDMDVSVSTQRSDKSPARWSDASADHPKSTHDDNDDDSSNASGSDNDDDDESIISQAHSAAQSVSASVSLQTSKGRGRSKSNKTRSSPDDAHKEKVAGGRVSKKPKKKANRFACTGYDDCNLSFTRSEHLIRHIRKHTGERPYECHCGRRFSRLDNLRQHASTVHANEDIPNDSLAASVAGFRRPGAHDDMPSMPAMPIGHAHGHSRSLSHPNSSLLASGPAPVYGSASISSPSGHHPSAGLAPGSLGASTVRPVTAEYSPSPFPSGSSFLPPPGHSGHSAGVPAASGHPGPIVTSSTTPAAPISLGRRPVRGHSKAFSTSNIAYDPREARSQPYPKYHSARPPQLPPLAIDRTPYEDPRQQQQQQQQQQQTATYSHSANPSVSSTREYPYSHRPVTPTDCPTPASATFSHTAGSPGWEHNTVSSPMSHTPNLGHSHSQSQSHAHNRTRSMVTPGANGFSHSNSTPSTLGQINHGRRYPDGLLHSHSDANHGHNRRMSVPSLNRGSPPFESPARLSYRMQERRDSFEQVAEDSRRRSIYHSPPTQSRLLQATSPPDSPTRRVGDVRLPGIQSLLPSTPEVPFTGYSRAPMPTAVHQRQSTSVRFADDDHPAHVHHAHAQRQRDMEYQHHEGPPPSSSSPSSAYPYRGHSYTESAPLNSISGRPSRNFRRMARHMEEEEPRIVSSSAAPAISASANNMSGGSRQHQHPSNPNVTNRTGQMEHPNLTQFGFPGRGPVQQPLPPISSSQPSQQQQRMSDMARLDALVAVATSQKEKPLTARV